MKHFFTTLLFLIAFLAPAFTCDCIFIGTFCETITYGNNGQVSPDYEIDYVKVIAADPEGVDVQVLQVFFGQATAGQTLHYIRGNGADCIPMMQDVLPGKTYIFAGRALQNDWHLSACGVTYLPVDNGTVNGPIAPGVTSTPLGLFNSVINCVGFKPGDLFNVHVRPTLAANSALLLTDSDYAMSYELKVFDVLGRLLYQKSGNDLIQSYPITVDMSTWSNGCYFFSVSANGGNKTVKVLKGGE